MTLTRRSVLKGLTGAAAASAALSRTASAANSADQMGMLYDATRCIGCKACVVACHEANDLPPDRGEGPLDVYDAPERLSWKTKNIIKLYQGDGQTSYMKQQCMHCLDPACCGACMLGALQKREHGIVWWDGTKCVGCRYCQMACPFNIPKFEWESSNPRIIKCELCRHLIAKGGIPACCKVCPAKAVIYGSREELLVEARRRLKAEPSRYVNRIYGEHDGGGTQVLYLSAVPFEKLGLPDLGTHAQAATTRAVQNFVFRWVYTPMVLLAFIGAGVSRNLPKEEETKEERL
jgi:Fe-S-cluster-containing dehydrogenase component